MSYKVKTIAVFEKQAKRLIKKYVSLKTELLQLGGARIIANIVITDATVYLLSIYDKSEKENLTDKELDELLKAIPK